ncbi:MAG: phosphoenolpyruvate synthase PpsA, partial [Deltaproteobacteria bacterium]|nr:phosphoenolpyruvate synthase PpsA [Deltaproteobacteria bacterium]
MSKLHKDLFDDSDLSFNVFHDLMSKRIREILLVSSPYDAFIMEEDGRIAERIIHEYRGLNLSRPPKLTWVSTAAEAMDILSRKKFDLVITMPRINDMDPFILCKMIKQQFPDLFVYLLEHNAGNLLLNQIYPDHKYIDKMFVWYGNDDLLLSIIKSIEDQLNVVHDTRKARIRVVIYVEDSPIYCSSILPLLYREVVMQTQNVMEGSLNDAHRNLMMRARPKILVAENFEEAINLYRQFKPYLLSVLSDVRFQRNGKLYDQAGFILLDMIRKDSHGMPLLVFSSEESNRQRAMEIPALFINKHSQSLHSEIKSFFINHLAFGDFIFRMPDGKKVAKASNLREMEKIIPDIPDESIDYHARRNHFSTWLMARSEIELASRLRYINVDAFSSAQEIKKYLIDCCKERRIRRQKGVVTDFAGDGFDADADFTRIGKGSLGGKARGLAFMSNLLNKETGLTEKFPDVKISIPKTMVITTTGFDSFMEQNASRILPGNRPADAPGEDADIVERFMQSNFPKNLRSDLKFFLSQTKYPLAVRSSSLLEDAQYMPCAGIYKTYMIPNNNSDILVRLDQLVKAIKLVYASTYLATPRAAAGRSIHRTEEEKMAVIIQQVTGSRYGDYFYPAVSGLAQSYNYYTVSYMKPEEGIVHIAFGLGKTVVEGGAALRFCPKYPRFLPQFSTVDDILQNSQRRFFALRMDGFPHNFGKLNLSGTESGDTSTLSQLDINDMQDDFIQQTPLKMVASTYLPDDNKIRDTIQASGQRLLTFAGMLKYNAFPLSEILMEILKIGQKGMGCPVEIEFAVNTPPENDRKTKPEFDLLQIRPMSLSSQSEKVEITGAEISKAVCLSDSALGNGIFNDIYDILFVKQDSFDPSRTRDISAEISSMNKSLMRQNRPYLLIGPGRWGSADRWLGIPVTWHDIAGVGVIIETSTEKLKADPSQGTHFFHNITSLGIGYLTVLQDKTSFLDFDWLNGLPVEKETGFLRHVRLKKPLLIKINGKGARAVILSDG